MYNKLFVIWFTFIVNTIVCLNIDRTSRRDQNYDNTNREIHSGANFTRSPHNNRRGSTNTAKFQHFMPDYHEQPDMIYPSDLETITRFNDNNNVRKRESCDFGLCEGVDNYPQEKILRLLRNASHLRNYFKKTELPTTPFSPSFTNRNKDVPEDQSETLCSSTKITTFPKSARNTRNVEMTVVNVDGHTQGVVYEKCSQDKSTCKFSELFPQGYTSSCQQKYGIRKLMVLVEDEKLDFDNFELPSCCVCTIKNVV